MKTPFALFALVSVLSGCGGEMTMFVGHLTSTTMLGGTKVDFFDDTGRVIYLYRDGRSPGIEVTGAGAPLYFSRQGQLLTLDESVSDSSYENPKFSRHLDFKSGSGEMVGLHLQFEVTALNVETVQNETKRYDETLSFTGYIQAP